MMYAVHSHIASRNKIYLASEGQPAQAWGPRQLPPIPPSKVPAAGVWFVVQQFLQSFDVDVTTVDPGGWNYDGSGPVKPQLRVVIGGSWQDWWGVPMGGAANTGCFKDQSRGNSVFVFSETLANNPFMVAMDCLHEIGHAIGLGHQVDRDASGIITNPYRAGVIMGNPLFGLTGAGWTTGVNDSGVWQDDLAVLGSVLGGR